MRNVIDYIHRNPRNKLIFSKEVHSELNTINIGQLIAIEIETFINNKFISIKTKEAIKEILLSNIKNDNNIGKYISIKNIGILFEPELKVDVLQLFDTYSKTNALFVQWDGVIENNNLYFLTKDKGIKVNIKNINHITV
jgi:hypothetical protein